MDYHEVSKMHKLIIVKATLAAMFPDKIDRMVIDGVQNSQVRLILCSFVG